MDAKRIDDRLSVSPQLALADVADAKARGFRALIVNRPDAEGADQPSFAEIEREARAQGMEARHLPVEPGQATDAQAAAFGQALAELPGPVLAYCRTGTRSATLWALSEAGRRPAPQILGAAKAAGHDLGGLAPRLAPREQAKSGPEAT